ncbi:MAG: DMT family transporter [Chloroflexia bacterium]
MPSSTGHGYLLAFAGTAIWATTAIFIGYLSTRFGLPPLVLAFWRDLFAACALALVFLAFKRPLLFPPQVRRHLPFLAAYGLSLATFNALWTTSVARNGAAAATVLAYSSPAFTALVGRRLFGERLDAPKVAAILLSLLGCALVSGAVTPAAWQTDSLGIVVGLLSGVAFSGYSLFGKAAAHRGLPPWSTMLYAFSFAAAFLLLLQRPATLFYLGRSATGWGILTLLAIGPTIGGYGLYTVSLTYLPAGVANLIATLEPTLTALLAFLFLGEKWTALQWGGSALILLGVVLLRLGEIRRSPLPPITAAGSPPDP